MRLKLLLFSLVFVSVSSFATVTGISKATSAGHTRTLLATCTTAIASSTNVTIVTKCYRDGQFLIIEGKAKWTGAGGAGNLTITLPTVGAPLISTADLVGGTGVANDTVTRVGAGHWFDSGVGWRDVYPIFASTTTFNFAMTDQILAGDQFASGDSLNFDVKLPIVGWN